VTTSDFLTVTTHDGPGASRVLVAAGEIDRDSRDLLRHPAEQAIGEGHHRLVVDLSAVTFCDSSGLALLVDLHRDAEAHGGWLRLAAVPPLLRDMLGITNLDRLFVCHDTVEAATAEP
jgi:anti-sigma B factor antagonist